LITVLLREVAYCYPLRLSLERVVYKSLRPVLAFLQRPGWSWLHRLLRTRCPWSTHSWPVHLSLRKRRQVPALLTQHVLRQP